MAKCEAKTSIFSVYVELKHQQSELINLSRFGMTPLSKSRLFWPETEKNRQLRLHVSTIFSVS